MPDCMLGRNMRTTQIIHFKDGEVATFFGVVGVREKKDTHLKLEDGRKVGINRKNVNYYEILTDDVAKRTFGEMYGEPSANEDKLLK
jgi:hypothetical protein